MKCFYHTDMDGKCAGAIVHKYYVRELNLDDVEACQFIPINYKDEFPFDQIIPGELVVIVDFSLQKPGEWEKLFAITDNVIWIDHHKTAIEAFPEHLRPLLKGGIQEIGDAGCVLAWKYFYPGAGIPRIVELLGDYDIWAFKFGQDTNALQTGIRLYETDPEHDNWIKWLDTQYYNIELDGQGYLQDGMIKMLQEGYLCLKYRDMTWAGQIKAWSFFVDFEGYRAVCCNAGSVSSQLFDSVKDPFDLMMPFVFDGKQWTVSIYTKNKDIDVSEIAKRYGGGGHRGAAGFQCKELPFAIERAPAPVASDPVIRNVDNVSRR